MHVFYAVSLLTLIPPLTGAAVLVFALELPPRLRSTLALGTTFLLTALAFTILGTASALLDGRQPVFPYWVITGLPALTVIRMMQLELSRAPNLSQINLG